MCLCHMGDRTSRVQACAVLLGTEDRVPTQGRILRRGPLGLGTLGGQRPGEGSSTVGLLSQPWPGAGKGLQAGSRVPGAVVDGPGARRLPVPLGHLCGTFVPSTRPPRPGRSSTQPPCRCDRKRRARRAHPPRVAAPIAGTVVLWSSDLRRGQPVAAAGAAQRPGRKCACAGSTALPAAAAAPAPPPPPARTARPCPRRRPEPPLSSLAFASRASCGSPSPGRAPGPAGPRLRAGKSCDRARRREEAAGCGAAALERGARRLGPLGARSLARSLAPRLPHSAGSHPFPA